MDSHERLTERDRSRGHTWWTVPPERMVNRMMPRP